MRIIRAVVLFIAPVTACVCLGQDTQTLKVNVETVQVYATVTDPRGRFVTGLKVADFQAFEDGKKQQVDGFSSDDTPLSIGVLFDITGVMGDNLDLARQSALGFLRAGNFANEYFVLEFSNKGQVTQDYTNDLSTLEQHQFLRPHNADDGVIDAIQLGLEKLGSGKNPRKVLLVYTSGGSLKSEHKTSDVKKLARRLDAQIYGLSIVDTHQSGQIDMYESGEHLVESVDGESFGTDVGSAFIKAGRRIAVGLRNQYILGYRSTNPAHDGQYRRLTVKLVVPDSPQLVVHARAGYYAFEDGAR